MNPIEYDLDEATYHAHPALGSTSIRDILKSPAKFNEYRHEPMTPTDAMQLGTAVHARVLGTPSPIVVLDFENYRTKAAQVERDAVIDAGLVPVLVGSEKLGQIDAIAESVLAHRGARSILETAPGREVSLFATDPATGVDLKARFDIYGDTDCGDLKTAQDASPKGFTRAVWDHRYDVQQEHYLKVRELVTGVRPVFRFIAVESTRPYLVAVYELDEQWAEIGDVWATAGRRIYRECADADVWPGYGSETHQLHPPVGLIYEHQDRFETQEMVVA
jgi:hypothetical protein